MRRQPDRERETSLLHTRSHSVLNSVEHFEGERCESESGWSRPGVFAAGVLSGVGLASIGYLLGRMDQR